MKSKITEIKNRTIYIEDCLTELKKVIEEIEDEELNTSKELQVNETFMADGTASEVEDCETTDGCKKYTPALIWGGLILLLGLTIFLMMSE